MILKVADRTLDDREDQVHSHAAQTIRFDRVEVARVVGSGFCRTLQPEMKSQLCIVAEGRPPSATLLCLLVELQSPHTVSVHHSVPDDSQ